MPQIIILTEGNSNPQTAKTACSMIRYRRQDVVAVLDSDHAGETTRAALGVGDDLRFVSSLEEAANADTLLIGIAPPGGKIPETWRGIVLDAIARGMNVISGLHEFLSDDAEFASAAATHHITLTDVRKNQFREVSRYVPLRDECIRLHTVGHDCNVGKMVTAIELSKGLQRQGRQAKFIATGQTGIMVEGDGLPMDCIVSDFVSGAAEKLMVEHQHHDFLLIEGQGSLAHPSYSAVTLGILHGARPQGLIMCYEAGRESVTGIAHKSIPRLKELIPLYETIGSLMHPCKVIGVALNGRRLNDADAAAERVKTSTELELPVCDVLRDGPETLIQAALNFRNELLANK